MRELIFDYLKKYNIFINEFVRSEQKEFTVKIKGKNETIPHLKVSVNVEKEEKEYSIYLKEEPILSGKVIFDELSNGLIELINKNSEMKVTESNLVKGWFGWEAKNFSISFGFKNEELRFEARFSFKLES